MGRDGRAAWQPRLYLLTLGPASSNYLSSSQQTHIPSNKLLQSHQVFEWGSPCHQCAMAQSQRNTQMKAKEKHVSISLILLPIFGGFPNAFSSWGWPNPAPPHTLMFPVPKPPCCSPLASFQFAATPWDCGAQIQVPQRQLHKHGEGNNLMFP